jgi:tetratricopeptide (TPR) repeat protein
LDKAYVLATLGRSDDAAKIYNDLLASHAEDTDLLIQVASLAAEQKNYERAADMYVKIVDLYEKDADTNNDGNNIGMLVSAGLWYGKPEIGRFDDAIGVLDRAIILETFPTENSLVARIRTVFNYGKSLKDAAATEADPAIKQQKLDKASGLFKRAVELGNELIGRFPGNAQGFLYLSMAQLETGDPLGADVSFKRYQELAAAGNP